MTQAKVIITDTKVFVTGYSQNGATIIYQELHNAPIEHADNSDAVHRAKAVAFNYSNSSIIAPDATEFEVLSGKFNNKF